MTTFLVIVIVILMGIIGWLGRVLYEIGKGFMR